MPIPASMTATVLVAPHRFELQERPVPVPGDEDVLVRVRAEFVAKGVYTKHILENLKSKE